MADVKHRFSDIARRVKAAELFIKADAANTVIVNEATSRDSQLFGGQGPDHYRCESSCSWTCSGTCTGSCRARASAT